jgi:PadR family transcriptional regulator, regulatory protein PadR
MGMSDVRSTVVQGTLDMLVLKAISLEPMHGWGIGERIRRMSGETFKVNAGSLYLSLERLQGKGWVTAAWRTTENNRRAKYYRLTRAGARRLTTEQAEWRRAAAGIEAILRTMSPA